MFVMNASFETDKKYEDKLRVKAQKNKGDIQKAEGNISFECWRKDHGDTVEYVFVSKWKDQADFKNWISREEHVQEHKEMNKKRKEGEQDGFKLKKVLRSYELLKIE
ncbi:antibiotic biosynthesis monooxygenase family protein [Camelliibacillus cellulosilyticus]|uniref:Antibiotic biosynthesis monooxygenase family protein n=1 Tax=Camelliibacillus cellulosilyticus TaxID=2174486 RepID=A0ABV9GSC9_9BACL